MPKLKPGTLIPTVAEDKAIAAAARRDPDARPLTQAQWKAAAPTARTGRALKESSREPVKIHLDPDVLAVLRATGKDWPTRVNQILRERFAL